MLYEFGAFRLDSHERLLFRNGEQVPLTPKVFDILLVLVQSSGHVLTKEELLAKVWPDSFVEEGNLNRHISTLRKALGDNLDQPECIDTIPKRGYRFIANVKEVLPTPERKGPHEAHSQAETEQAAEGTVSLPKDAPVDGDAGRKRSWSAGLNWKFWVVVSTTAGILLFLGMTFLRRSQSPGPQRVYRG